jgi:hypothetical protein
MSVYGTIHVECETKTCHACLTVDMTDDDINITRNGFDVTLFADGWRVTDDGVMCPDCAGMDERDDAYERAAARARNNDFADTGGKDWT